MVLFIEKWRPTTLGRTPSFSVYFTFYEAIAIASLFSFSLIFSECAEVFCARGTQEVQVIRFCA